MRTYLFIGRIVILTLVALICGLPALLAQATDHLPGAGIPEFMGAQPAFDRNAPRTVVVPAQATWVDDIANALGSYFKAHYPTSDFTSYAKKLTQVRDAEDRGEVENRDPHILFLQALLDGEDWPFFFSVNISKIILASMYKYL